MNCTAAFEANPDVSGIGIMITFYAQGAFNMCLAVYSWAVGCFPSKQIKLKMWVDKLFNTLVFGSTAAGYALCIAAFSQWSSITIYHLFLCYTFSGAISVANPSVKIDRLRSVRPLDRIRGSYFLGYQFTLIAINCVTIYRFSFWEDTAGKCFIVWIDGTGNFDEQGDAILWLYVNLMWSVLSQLVPPLVTWWGWSQLWVPTKRQVQIFLMLLLVHIPRIFMFVWGLYWTIRLTIANQRLIVGNEYSFGFGQVGALVTLLLSLSGAHISYIEHKEQRAAEEKTNDSQITSRHQENAEGHMHTSLPISVTQP